MRKTIGALTAKEDAVWSQQAELTAPDGVEGDDFGTQVAISGSTAVVGAIFHASMGSVYVFVRSGKAWSLQAELVSSDEAVNDDFGTSVAISGSTIVVGARNKDMQTGAAYVFVRAGTSWSQQAELTASDGGEDRDFGVSVAISRSGSTVVVGADGGGSAPGDDPGTAYVFTQSGTAWSQQAELVPSGGVGAEQFGYSVAISGAVIGVGAPGLNSAAGAAFVFKQAGGTWSQKAELTASDGPAGDNFGISVGTWGSTIVVGAPAGCCNSAGAAYVFVRSGKTWPQQAELTASDGAEGNEFGLSVAITRSTVLAGAFGTNDQTGAAYVFTRSGTTWSQQAELTASDSKSGNFFAVSVAISGSTAIVGSVANHIDTGAAYVFINK